MSTHIIIGYKGSAKSGNWGHEGRPGKEGGSLPTGKSHGAVGATATTAEAGAPVQSANTMQVPKLSIPVGTVPEHEKGDRDGKMAYQEWYASLETKPNLADALAMRRFFAERALELESQLAQQQAETTAEERQKRMEEERAKGPPETPAQKKKRLADEKKAASAGASAAKKKAAEEAKTKKKAESEAAKKKKAEEAASKKAGSAAAAASKKAQAEAAKKKAGEAKAAAAQAKIEAAQKKVQDKLDAQVKVAESVGLSKDGLALFQEAFDTLKSGGSLPANVASVLSNAGLIIKQGDNYTMPSAARSLLSAIQAGDAMKARDALAKLGASSKEIGRVKVVGKHIVMTD